MIFQKKKEVHFVKTWFQIHKLLLRPLLLFTLTVVCIIRYEKIIDLLIKSEQNDLLHFEKKEKMALSHMDIINPSSILKPSGFLPIDKVHRNGKIHQGTWIYFLDKSLGQDFKFLVLKRAEHLITCPNTWSLLGEHNFRDEDNIETVRRGILEELGKPTLEYVLRHGRISNLTEFPVYYERDYGVNNEGRIDRQITYLWMVEANLSNNTDLDEHFLNDGNVQNILQLDDEVADHKWVTLNELSDMLKSKISKESNNPIFCHETIVSLTQFGLDRLIQIKSNL